MHFITLAKSRLMCCQFAYIAVAKLKFKVVLLRGSYFKVSKQAINLLQTHHPNHTKSSMARSPSGVSTTVCGINHCKLTNKRYTQRELKLKFSSSSHRTDRWVHFQ